MDVLLTCGVCGLVEPAAGAGSGGACPRCGSRAVEAVELPETVSVQAVIAHALHQPSPLWLHLQRRDPAVPFAGIQVVGGFRTAVGGTHVPMVRAA